MELQINVEMLINFLITAECINQLPILSLSLIPTSPIMSVNTVLKSLLLSLTV